MKQIVYVASSGCKKIYVWQMNEYGLLQLLQIIDTPGHGQPMVIHPNKNYLYVGVQPNFGIISYHINECGLLTEIDMIPLSSSPTYLTTDLYGTTLYSVSYSGNCLTVYPIDKYGTLKSSIQTLKGLIHCHSANVDIYNKILWVPCLHEDRIRLYNIGTAGYLTPSNPELLNSLATRAGPRHMVFHNSGNYGYVINELSGTIDVIAIENSDLKNNLCIIQTLDIMPADFNGTRWASDIHITPDNRWIYCCDRTASIISSFETSKDGNILYSRGFYYTETQPRSFNIDYYGRFLIVAGQKSNFLSVYIINQQTGMLKFLKRYASGQNPMWVSILSQ